jgi:hypothetical protein
MLTTHSSYKLLTCNREGGRATAAKKPNHTW